MVTAQKSICGLHSNELNVKQLKLFLDLLQRLRYGLPGAEQELKNVLSDIEALENDNVRRILREGNVEDILAKFKALRKLMQQIMGQFPEFEANLTRATH